MRSIYIGQLMQAFIICICEHEKDEASVRLSPYPAVWQLYLLSLLSDLSEEAECFRYRKVVQRTETMLSMLATLPYK